jgi:hypothetical protein
VYRTLMTALVVAVLLAISTQSQGDSSSGQSGRRIPEAKLPPLSVLSIIPAQGEPGTTVTLNGTGFTGATTAMLGILELPSTVIGGKLLSIVLPDLAPGVYALYLRREDGSTSRAYNFMLLALKPVASSLAPDTISTCASGKDREVVLSGANFQNGTRVLLDGAAISTRLISASALSFLAPQLGPGLHQVQVLNPPEALSGTLALFLDSRPEILGVTVGNEYVSYYELIVSGKNFQQTSVLMADGARVGSRSPAVGDRDQLVYQGCNQILYQRHPYDPSPKEMKLQVVNQNGEESNLFSISAP